MIDSEIPNFLGSSNQASPVIAEKSQDSEAIILENAVFFPAISLLDFQQKFRVDGSHREAQQIECLRETMSFVNDTLFDPFSFNGDISWVCYQQQQGYDKLKDVPGADLGNCSEKLSTYCTAIYAGAKSLLIQRYPDLFFGKKDLKGSRSSDADNDDHYHNIMRKEIYKLVGKPSKSFSLL